MQNAIEVVCIARVRSLTPEARSLGDMSFVPGQGAIRCGRYVP
jgi:hypothetical protein